jgi:hypothetical protein
VFSFGLNVPFGGAPSGGLSVDAGAEVPEVVVAAPLDAAPNSVAPSAPPPKSDPAIAAVVMLLRTRFILIVSFTFDVSSKVEA